MRALLAVAAIVAPGCRGPSGAPDVAHAVGAPPTSTSISITLDRTTIAATDELTGTIHVAWSEGLSWRFELANESAPLLDLVVEGARAPARIADLRFRVVPCPAFAARSRASSIPLRMMDPGNHAMRITCDVRGPDGWTHLESRWSTFDVVDSGRPLAADDLDEILIHLDETRIAEVFAVGRTWPTTAAWNSFRECFTEVGDAGLECTSHEAPPFFARMPFGRSIPIRNGSKEVCNFRVLWVEGGIVTANHYFPPGRSLDARDVFSTRGLFRVTCDVHPKVWGWLLIE